MGRRTSLAADAVIAVLASGFTRTAQEKAIRHGIILRDFASLSREEIQNWGKKWKLTVNYCEFSAVTCFLKMILHALPQLQPLLTLMDSR